MSSIGSQGNSYTIENVDPARNAVLEEVRVARERMHAAGMKPPRCRCEQPGIVDHDTYGERRCMKCGRAPS